MSLYDNNKCCFDKQNNHHWMLASCWCCWCAGLTSSAVTRLEMVGLLCVTDRTHSQLIDAIPETCGVSHHDKDYESIIQQVSTGYILLASASMSVCLSSLNSFKENSAMLYSTWDNWRLIELVYVLLGDCGLKGVTRHEWQTDCICIFVHSAARRTKTEPLQAVHLVSMFFSIF